MNLIPLLADIEPVAPRFSTYPLDYIVDAPNEVRWRAWWERSTDRDRVIGIELRCYPVTELTPQGAWIDENAYWHHGWQLSGITRWVSNTGGHAWAKPTRQAAVDSIAIRYERWASRMAQDIGYFLAAGHSLKALVPERAAKADELAAMIETVARRRV